MSGARGSKRKHRTPTQRIADALAKRLRFAHQHDGCADCHAQRVQAAMEVVEEIGGRIEADLLDAENWAEDAQGCAATTPRQPNSDLARERWDDSVGGSMESLMNATDSCRDATDSLRDLEFAVKQLEREKKAASKAAQAPTKIVLDLSKYKFVGQTEDAVRRAIATLRTIDNGAPLTTDPMRTVQAFEACNALVRAYKAGKKAGGSVDWADLDFAHDVAKLAMKDRKGAK